MSRLVSLLRRRGLVLPSFEIYGGVSGLVDYGPVGASIKRRVVDAWIRHWGSITNVVEIDSPTITPEPVLVASGHVGEFNDKMSECNLAVVLSEAITLWLNSMKLQTVLAPVNSMI